MTTTFQIEIKTERVRAEQRNPALFYYEIRHGDDWDHPETLERSVFVNFWGTLTSTVNLRDLFKKRDYFEFKPNHRDVLYEHCDSGEFFDGKLLFPKLKIGGNK